MPRQNCATSEPLIAALYGDAWGDATLAKQVHQLAGCKSCQLGLLAYPHVRMLNTTGAGNFDGDTRHTRLDFAPEANDGSDHLNHVEHARTALQVEARHRRR